MYGGHIVEDWDRRLANAYLFKYFNETLLEGMEMFPAFFTPANTMTHKQVSFDTVSAAANACSCHFYLACLHTSYCAASSLFCCSAQGMLRCALHLLCMFQLPCQHQYDSKCTMALMTVADAGLGVH